MHYQPHLDEQPTASPSPRHAGVARRFAGAFSAALSAAQARFRRARAGSVLIIVVALLVLIALAGTALIVTARTDRFATGQNLANTQIELLVDAAVRLTKAQLIEDLFGHNVYRPATATPDPIDPAVAPPLFVPTAPGEYEPFDSPQADTWLASRLPVKVGNKVYWPYVSSPMVIGQSFESPDGGFNAANGVATYDARQFMQPTFIFAGGELQPAFITVNASGQTITVVAADADGDGIADSGLFRLPVGQLNGVTYYVGARIIDNGAAFNANVHMQPNREAVPVNIDDIGVPADLFTTNVDFKGAFYDGNVSGYPNYGPDRQMFHLNWYRTGSTGVPAAMPPASDPPSGFGQQPVDDNGTNGTPRTDFEWLSIYDQWYHQLGRRLDNPGYYIPGQKFRTLSSEDATSVAYRFILRNPNALVASPLEQMLLPTLEFPLDPARTAPGSATSPRTRTQPYSPNEPNVINNWFEDNFNMLRSDQIFSRRAITVTRNPMSTAVALHNMSVLPNEVKIRIYNDATHKIDIDQAVNSPNLMPDPTPANPADPMPLVPRTNINTAPFGELWRAFWMVMDAQSGLERRVDNAHDVPLGAQAIFRNPLRNITPSTDPQQAPVRFDLTNTLLLRAAIAAVSAEDQRDSDTFIAGQRPYNENVTSRRIYLSAIVGGTPTPVEVQVFGNEPQPFITEVYANNESAQHPLVPPDPADPNAVIQNPKGYVAVELYNPTNVTINLRGWHLGVMRRVQTPSTSSPAYPRMTVVPLGNFAGFSATPGLTVIFPGQRIVLENYNNGNAADNAAQYRPKSIKQRLEASSTRKFYVRDLHAVLEDGSQPRAGELVLLRPRRGDGRSSIDPNNEYRELARNPISSGLNVNLDELAPVDSFDFTGFLLAAPTAQAFQEMHYVRQNNGAHDQRWKCVYPGKWTEAPNARREDGLVVAQFPAPALITDDTAWSGTLKDSGGYEIKLGVEDDLAGYANPYPGIHLNDGGAESSGAPAYNNTHTGVGPNKLKDRQNHFPFGQFARDGDILNVPFIGAYTVRTRDNANAGRPPLDPSGNTPNRAVILEMNSISRDSFLATDNIPGVAQQGYTYTQDDQYEMIGHFCPLASLSKVYRPQDFPSPIPAPGLVGVDPYGWAADLFEYLSVDAPHGYEPEPAGNPALTTLRPHGDYLPNVKPSNYGTYQPGVATGGNVAAQFRENARPQAVTGNDNLDTAQGSRPAVEGRVNLNTASVRLIAALNMWPSGAINADGLNDNNEQLAKMIVAWRDGDPVAGIPARGPFRSIYDLNRVFNTDPTDDTKRFQSAAGKITSVDAGYEPPPNTVTGDITPRTGQDNVSRDFEAPFLMMNRISNLVSTRSDSYTVYIVVQGWRGVGSKNPTLVVQRRAAYLADRSGVSDGNRDFTPVFVPTN